MSGEQDDENITWIKPRKVFIFHDKPINELETVFHGKQYLPNGSRDVAVKIIKFNESEEQLAKRLMEARLPNVINVYDVGTYNYMGLKLYIIMEVCPKNLSEYVEDRGDNAMEMATFLSIFNQLLNGIKCLHDLQILHRDIKPDNILVTESGEMKYSDFGISKQFRPGRAEVTQTVHGAGSDGYRSPEAYTENAKLTAAADIFSLAIVVTHVISNGRHPFGPEPYDWRDNIRNKRKPDLSIIPQHIPSSKRAQLTNLIAAMLKPDPHKRPSVEEIKSHAFFTGQFHGTRPLLQLPPRRRPPRDSPSTGTREEKRKFWQVFSFFRGIFGIKEIKRSTPCHRPYILERDFEGYSSEEEEAVTIKDSSIRLSLFEKTNILVGESYGNHRFGRWKSRKVIIIESERRYRDQLQNYKKCLQQFQHPNIVQLLAVTETQSRFVIETRELGSLKRYLQSLQAGAVGLRDYLGFICQISRGMSYIASTGHVHRELRLVNILIGSDGICKIAGFWNTGTESMRSGPGPCLPRWTAPEVIRLGRATMKSDVWSFGVVVVEIFNNGKEPFAGIKAADIMERMAKGHRMLKPDNCPQDVYAKVLECWDKDPNRRGDFAYLQSYFIRYLRNYDAEIEAATVRPPEVKCVSAKMINISEVLIGTHPDCKSYGTSRFGQWDARKVIVLKSKKNYQMELDNYRKCLELFDHPNIVLLLARTTDRQAILVLESMENGSLRDYFHQAETSDLNLKDYLSLIYQIACGMSYIVSKIRQHGDLRPDNILVGSHGTCKIAGFWGVETRDDAYCFAVLMLDVFEHAKLDLSFYLHEPDEAVLPKPYLCPESIHVLYIGISSGTTMNRPEFKDVEKFFSQYLTQPASHLLSLTNDDSEDIIAEERKKKIRKIRDKLWRNVPAMEFEDSCQLLHKLLELQQSDDLDTLLQITECELRLQRGKELEALKTATDFFEKCSPDTLENIPDKIEELSEISSPLRSIVLLNVLCDASTNPVFSSLEWIKSLSDGFSVLIQKDMSITPDLMTEFFIKKVRELLARLHGMDNVSPDIKAIDSVNCIITIGYGYILIDKQENALRILKEGLDKIEVTFGFTEVWHCLGKIVRELESKEYWCDKLEVITKCRQLLKELRTSCI